MPRVMGVLWIPQMRMSGRSAGRLGCWEISRGGSTTAIALAEAALQTGGVWSEPKLLAAVGVKIGPRASPRSERKRHRRPLPTRPGERRRDGYGEEQNEIKRRHG